MVEIIGNTVLLESLKMCRIFTKHTREKRNIFFSTPVFQVEYERNQNPRTPSLTSTGTSTGINCSLFDFRCTSFYVYYKYCIFKMDKCFVSLSTRKVSSCKFCTLFLKKISRVEIQESWLGANRKRFGRWLIPLWIFPRSWIPIVTEVWTPDFFPTVEGSVLLFTLFV
jgi:hypothetical protein